MLVDLRPFEISEGEYINITSSIRRKPYVETVLYDCKEKYGIDNGYFSVNGMCFEFEKTESDILIWTYDYSIFNVLNISEFNERVRDNVCNNMYNSYGRV